MKLSKLLACIIVLQGISIDAKNIFASICCCFKHQNNIAPAQAVVQTQPAVPVNADAFTTPIASANGSTISTFLNGNGIGVVEPRLGHIAPHPTPVAGVNQTMQQ